MQLLWISTREHLDLLISRYGIFRLTNPPGLDYILNCTQSATFHQHHIDNLYTDARNPPGHVYHSNQLPFRTKDLRSPRQK